MKKLFSILLLFSFSLIALATSKENPSFEKAKTNEMAVTSCQDLSFVEMELSPLDVFAPEELATIFISEKTCKGFSMVQDKPPVCIANGVLNNIKRKTAFEIYQHDHYLVGSFLSKGFGLN